MLYKATMAQSESHIEQQTGFPVISNREVVSDFLDKRDSRFLFVPKPPAGKLRREDVKGKNIPHLVLHPHLIGDPTLLMRQVFEWMGAYYSGSHQTSEGKDVFYFVVPEERYAFGDWFIGQGGSISRGICEYLLVHGEVSISEISIEEYNTLCERSIKR
jgi:hypothetical protein